MGFIYRLTSPSGKSYVGQTTRLIEKRLLEHTYPNNCVALYNAINYYGWEKFEKEWIEVPDEDLDFYEEMLIALLGTLSPGGYNLQEGGGNKRPSEETRERMSEALRGENHYLFGKHQSEETKQRISKTKLGKTMSKETKQKMSDAQSGEKHPMYGKQHTDDTKQKMSEAKKCEKHPMYGKQHTDDTKQKMSEAKKGENNHWYGKTLTEETKQKMSKAHKGENNPLSKKIYQYDLDGNFIASFASSGEAAEHLGIKSGTSIRRCVRGKQYTAYNFKWTRDKL